MLCARQQAVVLQLPFGSCTPTQRPAAIDVTANLCDLADVGKPLAISASRSFIYGTGSLNSPTDALTPRWYHTSTSSKPLAG